MSLIERIKAISEERRVVSVAAWADDDGTPAALYALPLSVADMKWIQARHKDFLNSMQVEGMVDLIIRKVEDKAGEKLFSLEDKPILMRKLGLSVVAEIFGELFGDIGDDAEKN